MGETRNGILAWEARWSVPAGLATFAAVALLIGATIAIGPVSGEGNAEVLESAHDHKSAIAVSAALQAIGFALLVAPLYFLFRAAAARTDRVRKQLVWLVIVAPLFFSVFSVLNAVATTDSANQFVAGEAKPTLSAEGAARDCRSDRKDVGAKEFREEFDAKGTTPLADCTQTKVADDAATNAIDDSSLRAPATGFGLAGRLGLAFALFYSCLWAMRVGLLTRFWGSLGMALGVAALLLLPQFTMIFFVYFGLLLVGKLPSGKPPAWEAGEAVPWPTPGEQAAAKLEPADPDESEATDGERRKRKERSPDGQSE